MQVLFKIKSPNIPIKIICMRTLIWVIPFPLLRISNDFPLRDFRALIFKSSQESVIGGLQTLNDPEKALDYSGTDSWAVSPCLGSWACQPGLVSEARLAVTKTRHERFLKDPGPPFRGCNGVRRIKEEKCPQWDTDYIENAWQIDWPYPTLSWTT